MHGVERDPTQTTTFDNTYQTMPDTKWNYWDLIRFNEFVDIRMAACNG